MFSQVFYLINAPGHGDQVLIFALAVRMSSCVIVIRVQLQVKDGRVFFDDLPNTPQGTPGRLPFASPGISVFTVFLMMGGGVSYSELEHNLSGLW